MLAFGFVVLTICLLYFSGNKWHKNSPSFPLLSTLSCHSQEVQFSKVLFNRMHQHHAVCTVYCALLNGNDKNRARAKYTEHRTEWEVWSNETVNTECIKTLQPQQKAFTSLQSSFPFLQFRNTCYWIYLCISSHTTHVKQLSMLELRCFCVFYSNKLCNT